MEVKTICEETSINNEVLGTKNNQSTSSLFEIEEFHQELSENSEEDNVISSEKYEGISKKQRKRMAKKEKWLKVRLLKRAKEKEKLKLKKKIAASNNIKLGPSRKELKYNKMATSNCKVHVVIDLSFNDLMNDKDLAKCVKQAHHCYSVNRRYPNPMQFYMTSFGGRFEEDMKKHDGYQNWDINMSSDHFTKLFDEERLVYLTSDSDNIISSLEDDKVYIIGGLVDHNSHKGLCLRIAMEKGIAHGQLPIGEYLKMSTRKTLTIDHVFEIMHGVCHGKNWEDALLSVIPARKGAHAKFEERNKKIEEECCDSAMKMQINGSEEELKVQNADKNDPEVANDSLDRDVLD